MRFVQNDRSLFMTCGGEEVIEMQKRNVAFEGREGWKKEEKPYKFFRPPATLDNNEIIWKWNQDDAQH